MKVNPQANLLGPSFRAVRPAKGPGGGQDFLSFLKGQISEVDRLQHEAAAAATGLALGKVGIQETMISIQKAGISFRLLVQVRNKAIEAYHEIMRMQF